MAGEKDKQALHCRAQPWEPKDSGQLHDTPEKGEQGKTVSGYQGRSGRRQTPADPPPLS